MFYRETDYRPVKGFEMAKTYWGKPLWTTRVYLVGQIMIDTAAPNVAGIVSRLVERHRPRLALITHHHEDHSGNAGIIKERYSLPVFGSRLTAEIFRKSFHLALFQHVLWGKPQPKSLEVIEGEITDGGYTLRAIPAPGHSPDMTVFLEPNRGWLFSGDLFLASGVKFFRDDEDFAQSKASLEKILDLDFTALFCSHNPKPIDGKKYLHEKLRYFQELEEAVKELRQRGLDVREITARLLGGEGFYPLLTSGRVAKRYLVKSILRSLENGNRRGCRG